MVCICVGVVDSLWCLGPGGVGGDEVQLKDRGLGRGDLGRVDLEVTKVLFWFYFLNLDSKGGVIVL